VKSARWAAALGAGLDGLVFTAGIGEHDAATRAEVVAGCRWLGMELERGAQPAGRRFASARTVSTASAWVVADGRGSG